MAATLLVAPAASAELEWEIAFSSDRNGNYDFYVMDADGTNLTRLTHYGDGQMGTKTQLEWSPDGTRIAFGVIDP